MLSVPVLQLICSWKLSGFSKSYITIFSRFFTEQEKIRRSENIQFADDHSRGLIIGLLRRIDQGEYRDEIFLDREVEVSEVIEIPTTTRGAKLQYRLTGAIQHLDASRRGRCGHFITHILRHNVFWRCDTEQPLEQSRLSDVRKSTHFIYALVDDYV